MEDEARREEAVLAVVGSRVVLRVPGDDPRRDARARAGAGSDAAGELSCSRGEDGPELPCFGEAREIAQAALFLASDGSSFITGADIRVDGAITAAYVTPEP